MMKFANNAAGSLFAAVNAGDETFTLKAGEGSEFPSLDTGDYFYARFGFDTNNEVVKVTGRAGDVMTCEALDNGWPISTSVIQTKSAEMFEDLAQADGDGQVLKDHELRSYVETIGTHTLSAGVLTLDYATGNNFVVTLSESVTSFVIANAPGAGLVGNMTVWFKQDATGGRTITWPVGCLFTDGEAPELSTDANAVAIFVFAAENGTWCGAQVGGPFS